MVRNSEVSSLTNPSSEDEMLRQMPKTNRVNSYEFHFSNQDRRGSLEGAFQNVLHAMGQLATLNLHCPKAEGKRLYGADCVW